MEDQIKLDLELQLMRLKQELSKQVEQLDRISKELVTLERETNFN